MTGPLDPTHLAAAGTKVLETGGHVLEVVKGLGETYEGLEALGIVLAALSQTKKGKRARRDFLDVAPVVGAKRKIPVVAALFGTDRPLVLSPATDRLPASGELAHPDHPLGYPHDLAGLQGFVPFLVEPARYRRDLLSPHSLRAGESALCAGSPKAHRYVRQFLPAVEISREGYRHQHASRLHPSKLEYVFAEDLENPKVLVRSMSRRGKETWKTRKAILRARSGGGFETPWRPKGYLASAALKSDFLLVSKLPRNGRGDSIVAFSGGHGAGSEAVRLLLSQLSTRDLRELADLFEFAYFQFVLEVKTREGTFGSEPATVRISDKLPPVALDIGPGDLSGDPVRDPTRWK